jgi:site-specific DNA-methyltransferase (adenine-specific)
MMTFRIFCWGHVEGTATFQNQLIHGDAKEVLARLAPLSISACITDPPYNYEFMGHKWNTAEIERRIGRASGANSKILVKNMPPMEAI